MHRRTLLKGIGTASIVSFAGVAAGKEDCVNYWNDGECYINRGMLCPTKCCSCYVEG